MADKLSIYNAALARIGSRKLSSLTENRASRRALDSVWDGGLPKRVLESGQWNASIRTIESIYDPDYTPLFGYQYAHSKPDDWVRTVGLSISENVTPPLTDYEDEHAFWYCNYDTLYIRYVSSNSSYGADLSLWPESQIEYIECELAYRVCRQLTGDDGLTEQLRIDSERAKRKAKSIDQMNQAPKRPPLGSWASARIGGNRSFGGTMSTSVVTGSGGSSGSSGSTGSGAFSDGFSDGFS